MGASAVCRSGSPRALRIAAVATLLLLVAAADALGGVRPADRRFGADGAVAIDPGRRSVSPREPSLAAGGRLLVPAVAANEDILIWRLRPDGRLDRSFGRGGLATVRVARGERLRTLVVQPDGKLLLLGLRLPGAGAIRRLLPNGRLDPSFNRGRPVLPVVEGRSPTILNDAVTRPGGGLIAAGGAGGAALLVGLSEDGAIDTTFGTGLSGGSRAGISLRDVAGGVEQGLQRIVRAPDGTYLAGGLATDAIDPALGASSFLIRYTADGDPADFPHPAGLRMLDGVFFDGLFVDPGGETVSVTDAPVVQRVTVDGRLDTSYGKRGTRRFPTPGVGVTSTVRSGGRWVSGGPLLRRRGRLAQLRVRFWLRRDDGKPVGRFGRRGVRTVDVGAPRRGIRDYNLASPGGLAANRRQAFVVTQYQVGRRDLIGVARARLP